MCLYFSIGKGRPREQALCQFYWHNFVPCIAPQCRNSAKLATIFQSDPAARFHSRSTGKTSQAWDKLRKKWPTYVHLMRPIILKTFGNWTVSVSFHNAGSVPFSAHIGSLLSCLCMDVEDRCVYRSEQSSWLLPCSAALCCLRLLWRPPHLDDNLHTCRLPGLVSLARRLPIHLRWLSVRIQLQSSIAKHRYSQGPL